MKSTKRICLWSGPRNISTALMYSFGNRSDTAVVDEPFYGYYLSQTKAKEYHPSAQEIIDGMECDSQRIIEQLLIFDKKPIYFIKNMPHHLLDLSKDFLKQMEHIILIRKPDDMVRSFAKVVHNPEVKDFGYQEQIELIKELKQKGISFQVVDSNEILEDPENCLRKLCEAVNIPFSKEMLQWPKGPRKEDGVWAKHWYHNVHLSTKFSRPKKTSATEPLAEELKVLVQRLEPLYAYIAESGDANL